MFRATADRVSKLAKSRLALVAAAPAALAAMVAPMMGAGPWFWHYPERRVAVVVRPDPVVVVPAPIAMPIVAAPAPTEVVPDGLAFTAYQSRDTIMLFATGSNRTGGFATSLRAIDMLGSCARVQLSNIAPCGLATQMISPFNVNAALHIERPVSSIQVRIANQVLNVPVVQVQSIS